LSVAFERVVTSLGEFVGMKDGGAGDWQPVEKGLTLSKRKPAAISTHALIAGDYEHPPEEAGVDWFYVVKKRLWVNPRKWYEVNLTDRHEDESLPH
jgi:hypothetical protein